jgi:hypothetical protein
MGSRTGTAVERAAILVGKATEAIESRTHSAAEFAATRLAGATEDMEARTFSATDEIVLKVRDATMEIDKHTTESFSQLLERSANVSMEVETRTQAAADVMQARATELAQLLDKASRGLIAAISSKGGEFAAEIEEAAESATNAIDAKAFAFTQSMMNNSNELARIITDASTSATSLVSRTLQELEDSARSSVSQASTTVAQTLKDLQQSTRGAIEQSKQAAISTVSEIRETHGMLSSGATALFERLRDANGALQDVLGGAQTNLSTIEKILSIRVGEFVSTLEQLLDTTDATTGKLDRQVSSFYGLTSRVLGDLGELAVQFDGHGKALGDAVALLEKANNDTMASVTERKNAIEELAMAADGRTEQLDKHLKKFSNLIDVSLRSAEDRARDAARLVAEATSEGARTLAERHAAIRATAEQQGKQTIQSLHELHERVSSESKDLFQQNAGEAQQLLQRATDRFAEIMHSMKQMSLDMQRELDVTRKELRRGVLELPEETAESMAQMRRVIVDQMEALAELNRIVARHGRAMDTVGTATEQPAARRSYGSEEPAIAAVDIPPEPAPRQAAGGADRSAQQRGRAETPPEPAPRQAPGGADRSAQQRGRAETPPPEPAPRPAPGGADRNTQQRGRTETLAEPAPSRQPTPSVEQSVPQRGRVEAPPVAPPAAPEVRGAADAAGHWLSNLLSRASRDGGDSSRNDDHGTKSPGSPATKEQRPLRADDRNIRSRIESLDSLSVDIANMIDHETAADLWERYDRGERNVFTRRLYTMQGRKAFDELRKRYKSDREFRQIVDRYIGEFERLLSDVRRDDRDETATRTYLTSDTGKVYTMLAHAGGRFE